MSIPDPIVLLDARARYVHPAFQMSRASTKTGFDAAGRMVTVPPNAIGWDHYPATGQARGYLAERQATNLLLHSNDLSQSAWSKFVVTVTPAATAGPDGADMGKLVEAAASGAHVVSQDGVVADGSPVTVSCIAAAAERSEIMLWLRNPLDNSNWSRCVFDLASGTKGMLEQNGMATAIASGMVDLGGGFYRCCVSGLLSSGVTGARIAISLRSNGQNNYEGDGTSGAYIGYAQMEQGGSPTSYIETGASTATRARDNLALPNMSGLPWWNSYRGTLLVGAEINPDLIEAGAVFISIGSNIFEIRRFTGGARHIQVAGSNTNWVDIVRENNLRRYMTLAMAWEGLSAIGAGLGGLSNDATLTTPVAASDGIGIGARVNGSNALGGHIRRAVYYPARVSNADLQSLTAIQE